MANTHNDSNILLDGEFQAVKGKGF